MCDNMIVGAACMAHSAVEGGQARLIVRPERRGAIFFLYYLQFFFTIFFSGGQYPGLSKDVVVATFFVLFLHLSISIRIVVERGVYVIVPISHI